MPKKAQGMGKSKRREQKRILALPVPLIWAAVLLMVVAGGFFLLNQQPKEALSAASPVESPNPASQWDKMVQAATKQVRYYKGAPNAPVTILEFSDFQ